MDATDATLSMIARDYRTVLEQYANGDLSIQDVFIKTGLDYYPEVEQAMRVAGLKMQPVQFSPAQQRLLDWSSSVVFPRRQ